MKISDSEIIERIKKGDVKVLEDLYIFRKEEFFIWAKQFSGLTYEDIEDIWQDVVIIFFENVKKNKLKVLTVKLNTYLFAIGKHLIYKLLNKRQLYITVPKNQIYEDETFKSFGEDLIEMEVNIKETEAFTKLSKSCQELLLSRYYYGMSIEDITKKTGLTSKNTTSASISRCLNYLKSLILKNGKE
jgi:RNA polymerase sigma factor (sigma-70 family)